MATPTVSLPSYIPDYRTGTLVFENGLPESYAVQQEIAQTGMLSCSFCFGLMQRPLYFPNCSHGACEPCMIKNWSTNVHGILHGLSVCPLCRSEILSVYSLRTFARFTEPEKRWFRILDVRCPNECGAVLSLTEMKDHRVRFCPRRIAECPNFTCTYVGTAEDLQKHFSSCMLFCELSRCCGLPVLSSEKENHNCTRHEHLLRAGNRLQYSLGGVDYNIAFKMAAFTRFSRWGDYIFYLEMRHARTNSSNIRNTLFPRRPLPSFMASPGDVIPAGVRVILAPTRTLQRTGKYALIVIFLSLICLNN